MDPVFPNRINGIIVARYRGLLARMEESRQVEHGPTKGALREAYLIQFLQSLLPIANSVKNGFICDVLGKISPQIDLILADTSSIPSVALSQGIAFVPVEAAISAIEVKSRLSSSDLSQLRQQADSIWSLRPIAETQNPGVHGIRLFIFAYESDLSSCAVTTWFESIPSLFGVYVVNGFFLRRSPGGVALVDGTKDNAILVFVSSLLHSIVKANTERRPYSLNTWRRYVVGVDPASAAVEPSTE